MSLHLYDPFADIRLTEVHAIQLENHPENFFEGEQYLLGDSGFAASSTIIPAYKENDARAVSPLAHRQRFNVELSKQRVTVEHTLGMLKSRYQSLRGLRHIIRDTRSFNHNLCHIRACAILHNIAVGLPDDGFWDEEDLPRLRAEWEAEAESIRTILDVGGEPGVERNEDMREALRYRFQTTNYRRPYLAEDDYF